MECGVLVTKCGICCSEVRVSCNEVRKFSQPSAVQLRWASGWLSDRYKRAYWYIRHGFAQFVVVLDSSNRGARAEAGATLNEVKCVHQECGMRNIVDSVTYHRGASKCNV